MERSEKKLVAITVLSGTFLIIYCVLLFVPIYSTKERILSPRTKLVERNRLWFFPIIVGSDWRLEDQELIFDGKIVWSAHGETSNEFRRNFRISPDEKFVVSQPRINSWPYVILELETGQQREIRSLKELDLFK